MIQLIFLVSLIIYIFYLFFYKKIELFENKINKKNIYYLVGDLELFNDNLIKYLYNYDTKELKDIINANTQGCEIFLNDEIENTDKKLFEIEKIEKYSSKNIKIGELGDKFNDNFYKNISTNSVFLIGFGYGDIQKIKMDYINDKKEELDKKRKTFKEGDPEIKTKDYIIPKNIKEKIFKEKIIKLNEFFPFYNITENLKYPDKYKNIKYLFFTLEKYKKSIMDQENINQINQDIVLWNLLLKDFLNNQNKRFIEQSKNITFELIDLSKDKVDNNGNKKINGIPIDLHKFICKREKCRISNNCN